MSFASSTVWECRASGSSGNGGGFDVGASFPADLAATSATTASPVVTSASYGFAAGDVGSYVFIRGGTNWTPGFYRIASVAGGAATLSAAVGAVVLYGGATNTNAVAGCATVASPTAGTWGVDYSQQNSARLTYSDMAIGATTTQFTSAANPCGVNLVGNIINVTGGTGFTVQRVQVNSVSGATATCDKSLGTAASTGGAGNLGGALDSPATAAALYVFGNKIFGSGSFATTATITFATGSAPASGATRLIGYGTTRGDGGRATITLSTNPGLTAINVTGQGFWIDNWVVDCSGLATSTGINLGSSYGQARNCLVKNFTQRGINGSDVIACEVTGGTSAATAAVQMGGGNGVRYSNIHDNACPGVVGSSNYVVVGNLIVNNTGAGSDGFQTNQFLGHIIMNTIHGNGRHGINLFGSNSVIGLCVRDNILSSNGGYGLTLGNNAAADEAWDGNAYYNNTSGPRNNVDNASGNYGVAPYINTLDVILTADPFVNAGGGNFSLNGNAGGGAAARGHGVPTSWPGNAATQAFPDMGAVQHQDSPATYVVAKTIVNHLYDQPEP